MPLSVRDEHTDGCLDHPVWPDDGSCLSQSLAAEECSVSVAAMLVLETKASLCLRLRETSTN